MNRILRGSFLLFQTTRMQDWKASFVPFVLGFVYLWLLIFDYQPTQSTFVLSLLSLTTTLGFASFGYVINELFDKEEDKLAGKTNKFEFVSKELSLLIVGFTLLTALLPWLFLPKNIWSFLLISIELASFLVYSVPPLRFKRFPLTSCIIDTLYAYVIPLMLSVHTYSLNLSTGLLQKNVLLLAAPLFFIGFRNILLHQVKDSVKDFTSNRITLPHQLGIKHTLTLLKINIVLEWISFFVVLTLIQLPITVMLSYLIYLTLKLAFSFNSGNTFNTFIPFSISDGFYQVWFPLIILMLLIIQDFGWFWLIILHSFILLLSFRTLITGGEVSKFFDYTVHLLSLLVNNIIFLSFLLFGVNLKKKQVSAWQFLTHKKTKS